MTDVLLYTYLGGWILTSILVAAFAPSLQDEHSPAPHPRVMSIVAGAVWPILVVALAQVGAVAVTAEVIREDEYLLTVDA
ncbi:hypothetical protein [Mycolicibacterium sp.]|uniref:hypothetical protein n=1 Tax=Mycolicibacterium sp. TaxID=2320850 RepID=UPI001A33E43C|nr:hypothetical protein [Mycolicibacterium sp.]MBJ7341924.1 hypothetical protein [Mycolicibacterium sp.]